MTTISAASPDYRRELGNGLMVRWSTQDDIEPIAHLIGMSFRRQEDGPPNNYMMQTTYQLMRGDHPMMGTGDFAIIEDTTREGSPIIACACLWRMRWVYEGVPFEIGRPEYVACDPAYRHRGLIRTLFEVIHARSQAEGHMAQAITGISYFYRQFGYEYALDLDGGRGTYLSLIPKLKEGTLEPFILREATAADIPLIMQYYSHESQRGIVWTDIPEYHWQYELADRQHEPDHLLFLRILMLLDAQGAVQGYVAFHARRFNAAVRVDLMGISTEVQWRDVLPSFLRGLHDYGLQMPTSRADVEPFSRIDFMFGREHPVYDVLGSALLPHEERCYAWYVRIADLPAFLRHIAPVLERRLAGSLMVGYTGELKIDCYRHGLRLAFEQGRFIAAEPWLVPLYGDNAHAGFPPLVLLQLVLGHRSLEELLYAFPDVWVNNDSALLLKTLFPAKPSAPSTF